MSYTNPDYCLKMGGGTQSINLEKFQWLIDRLKQEFPKVRVIYSDFDMGYSFGVGLKLGNKRHAVKVKYTKTEPDKWAQVYDEDEGGMVEKAIHFKTVKDYNLNDDPDKDKKVEEIIVKFREIFGIEKVQ